MNKHEKIIVLAVAVAVAIAAALTAPALAFADVSVYGQANLAVDMVNDGVASPGTSATTNQLNAYGSRLGFTGAHDLSGGMSLVWVLEGDVAVDTGAAGGGGVLFSRASNIGLKSDSVGTVALGRQDSPYKASTRGLDLFGDTAADNHANVVGVTMMGNGHDSGGPNAISYSSPSMNGFSVVVASAFGAETSTGSLKKGSAFGFAAMYAQGPLYATLAYDNVKFGDATTGDLAAAGAFAADDSSKAFKAGGSYAMDQFMLNAVIEKTTDSIAANGGDTTGTNLYLGGKFNVSSTGAVKLAYTKRGTQTTPAGDLKNDATQIAVGFDHGLDKSTMVYALYTRITQNAAGAADPSILSAGIKYSF